jgi:glycosyltransferase involved in cell wall biosynthesis
MPGLTIGIDYRPALSRLTGVGRYVASLTGALAGIDSENRYTLFSSSLRERASVDALPSNFELVDRRIPVSLLNALWHRVGQPSLDLLAGRSFDITHSPHPLILPSRRGRAVVTIHDLFFYRHAEATTAEIRRDYVPLVKAHAARADAVLTGSRTTKEDLVRDLGVDEKKIELTPYGIDVESFRSRPEEEERIVARYELPSRYLLSVATLEPRKNLPRLVEAVAQLVGAGWDGILLLAGGSGVDEAAIDRVIDRHALGARVRKLGYVPSHHLPAIYRRARALVSVSLWEGFGFPVLEAMACRIPVVASDIPTHREVAGDGATYVDPADPQRIASAIERVWDDDAVRSPLIEEGSRRLRLFSWDETARKTLAVYERLGRK